jgi:hypothetical protein
LLITLLAQGEEYLLATAVAESINRVWRTSLRPYRQAKLSPNNLDKSEALVDCVTGNEVKAINYATRI